MGGDARIPNAGLLTGGSCTHTVQFHGTEGRNAALGKPEIPPSPARYPFIVFNAKDIKDLQVTQRSAEVPQPPPIHDPAVLATPATLPSTLSDAPSASSAPQQSQHRQSRPAPTRAPVRGPELDLQIEFDFESSNARLAGLRLGGDQEASTASAAEAPKGYDKKSSFFDNISSDIKDRAEGKRANVCVASLPPSLPLSLSSLAIWAV